MKPDDPNNALHVMRYKKAAARGDVEAQFSLGFCYYAGLIEGEPQNHVKALEWFRKAANKGHVEAMCSLGSMEENDVFKACWFRKAANKGSATAKFNLGSMFEEGRHVEQNDGTAEKLFIEAAEKGCGAAKYKLGPDESPRESVFFGLLSGLFAPSPLMPSSQPNRLQSGLSKFKTE